MLFISSKKKQKKARGKKEEEGREDGEMFGLDWIPLRIRLSSLTLSNTLENSLITRGRERGEMKIKNKGRGEVKGEGITNIPH